MRHDWFCLRVCDVLRYPNQFDEPKLLGDASALSQDVPERVEVSDASAEPTVHREPHAADGDNRPVWNPKPRMRNFSRAGSVGHQVKGRICR